MRMSLVFLLLAAAAGAQRPDFSGTWVRVVDSAAARPSVATAGDAGFRVGDMGSGWGSPLTITQRADSVIVAYPFFGTYDLQPPIRLAFAMDGKMVVNRVMLGHAESKQIAVVEWVDSTLSIRTTVSPPPEVALGVSVHGETAGALVVQQLTLTSPTTLRIETFRSPVPGAQPSRIFTTYAKR
jgi:hypothetical protein